MDIWSVGHGTRSLEEFLAMLRATNIMALVDVRLAPGSRRHPHFGAEALADALGDTVAVVERHYKSLESKRSEERLAKLPVRAWGATL